jgi:adenylate kinase
LDKGELVPDGVVIRLVGETLAQTRFAKGFVLDGFPRTLLQAEELEKLLQSDGRSVEHAVSLQVSEDRVLERLTLRKVCTQCGAVYHDKYSPPKVLNECDRCHGALSTRADDRPEVVEKRLHVYEREFRPIIDFYKKKNLLREIDGNQPPEQVTDQILKRVRGG